MNIPGPIKTTPLIRKGFEAGKDALLHALSAADMNVLESRVFHDITGDEMLLCVDAPAEKIKDLTQQIEERHPYGRLFDMDVIGTDGMKLSRSFLSEMSDLRLSGAGVCAGAEAYGCGDAG